MDSTLTGSAVDASRATSGAITEQSSLSPLARLTLGALVALAAVGVWLQVLIFQAVFPPIGIIMTVGSLAIAGVLTRSWRWVPGLAAGWCGFLAAGNATAIARDLGNPDDLGNFLFNVVAVPVLVSGMMAGIAATVQNYRRPPAERRAPRWLPSAAVGVAGLMLGAALVALLPRSTTADVTPETLARLPGVTARGMAFDRGDIHIKSSQPAVLRVANADAIEHSFDIDELDVHTYLPASKTRLALFAPSAAGTYTFYCGIAGHRDQMRGTLVVDP